MIFRDFRGFPRVAHCDCLPPTGLVLPPGPRFHPNGSESQKVQNRVNARNEQGGGVRNDCFDTNGFLPQTGFTTMEVSPQTGIYHSRDCTTAGIVPQPGATVTQPGTTVTQPGTVLAQTVVLAKTVSFLPKESFLAKTVSFLPKESFLAKTVIFRPKESFLAKTVVLGQKSHFWLKQWARLRDARAVVRVQSAQPCTRMPFVPPHPVYDSTPWASFSGKLTFLARDWWYWDGSEQRCTSTRCGGGGVGTRGMVGGGVGRSVGGYRGTGPGVDIGTVLPCFGCFITVWASFTVFWLFYHCLG